MEIDQTTSKKKFITGKKVLIAIGIFIVLIAITKSKDSNSEINKKENDNPVESNPVGLKQLLKTEYFDVTVNDQKITFEIQTGNEFADKQADKGNIFLILNTTFKNTDTESRIITDGTLLVNTDDGKEFKFEKSETIIAEGWGIMLENINPLTTITTNVVYQIPEKLKAKVYYQPARTEKKIFLGDFDLTNLK